MEQIVHNFVCGLINLWFHTCLLNLQVVEFLKKQFYYSQPTTNQIQCQINTKNSIVETKS